MVHGLQCYSCSSRLRIDSPQWRCSCGGVLDVVGRVMFPREELAHRPWNFWRYQEALAWEGGAPKVMLGETITPLLKIEFRGWCVHLKLEYMLPTGSYKDRGMALCVNQLSKMGVSGIVEDSSGNAGASCAAYAAAAGMRTHISVPMQTSSSKINQIRVYGADCQLVAGTRIESATVAQTPREDIRYIGHSWNPFFACSVKSVAYEIAEQWDWRPPTWIVTPCGGGSLVLGLIDGFCELYQAKYITTLPKLLVVQSSSCAPIYQAWVDGSTRPAEFSSRASLAEGVALPNPCRGAQVLDAIRRYNAVMVQVDDSQLMDCWKALARQGIFVEPTAAVAMTGAWQAREKEVITGDVVILMTGHGLETKAQAVTSIIDGENPSL